MELWGFLYICYFGLLLLVFLSASWLERTVGPFLGRMFPTGVPLKASRKGTREFLSNGSVMDEPRTQMTMENFLRLCKEGAKWCIIDGVIFDLSEYLQSHPGGEKTIGQAIGKDATALFEGKTDVSRHVHSRYAINRLTNLLIGTLQADGDAVGRAEEGEGGFPAAAGASEISKPRSNSIFNTMQTRILKTGEGSMSKGTIKIPKPAKKTKGGTGEDLRPALLMDKLTVTGPSAANPVRKFELFVDQNEPFKLAPGDAIIIELKNAEGKAISRPYTPIPSPHAGRLDIFVKILPDGMLTQLLDNIEPGTTIFIRGPLQYTFSLLDPLDPLGFGCFLNVAMICGGSGISRMFQFIYHHANNSGNDPNTGALQTHMSLIWANRSEDDIFFRADICELEKHCGGSLKVVHVISAPSERWGGETGRIGAPLVGRVFEDFLRRMKESGGESPPYKRNCVILCGSLDFKAAAEAVLRWEVCRKVGGPTGAEPVLIALDRAWAACVPIVAKEPVYQSFI
ncbi:hypothetical protein BDK51DRAFT_34671 [Blyttiomyces helicus]|uniref:FAD-binding FR-type domain-containing protein n=1 Tax=Blyttiomyces helicus TaxID=388810 RepID=A0A4P9WHD2_9FUNG|nr:hypothetical protein BDK51DRAFT_34671 [Blyttiomyces helicus]|eukprot:RKO92229.1 hypothetical protein BDK51DRAFT_34671 [Blyttiomyces helicus]